MKGARASLKALEGEVMNGSDDNVTAFPGHRERAYSVDDARRIIEAIEVGDPAASRVRAVLSQVYAALDCLELAREYAERDPEFDIEWLLFFGSPCPTFNWADEP